MFKKMLALLAVVTLLLGCTAAHAENDVLTPILLKGAKMTADEWYATEETRALLAACMVVDLALNDADTYQTNAAYAVDSGSIYVGRMGPVVVVFLGGESQTIMGMFVPSDERLEAVTLDVGALLTPLLVDGIEALESHYEVSNTKVYDYIEQVNDALTGD